MNLQGTNANVNEEINNSQKRINGLKMNIIFNNESPQQNLYNDLNRRENKSENLFEVMRNTNDRKNISSSIKNRINNIMISNLGNVIHENQEKSAETKYEPNKSIF